MYDGTINVLKAPQLVYMNPSRNFSFLLNPSFSGRLKTGIFLALIVLITSCVLTFGTFNRTIIETNSINHSFEVKVNIEELFSYVKDAGRGVSGFLLSNDSSYLHNYRLGIKKTDSTYVRLKELTKDNPIQQQGLKNLNIALINRFASLDSMILTHNKVAPSVTKQIFDRSKETMQAVERSIEKIRKEENFLLNARYTQSNSYLQQSKIVFVIFMLVAILIIAICFYLLTRSLGIIQEKEKTYRNIFEYSKELLCLCNTNLDVLEANPTLIETFGVTSNEELNLKPFFSNARDAEEIHQCILKGEDVLRKELFFKGTDGVLHICLCSFILIDPVKKMYSVMLKDITERVRLQQEHEAMERFANIGKVSRMLAHEVRNPLTNINLALEGIRDENKDETLTDYFSIVERNSKRISTLITALLNSTKPNILEHSSVNVAELLNETLLLAKDRIDLNAITIKQHIATNIPNIQADKEKLSIALLNPIINAIEVLPKQDGVLQIEAFVDSNKYLHIQIIDNGEGMDEETKANIFHPFYTKKSGGTGLGLASTQNIILLHKGKITVKSTLGKGTIFTIQLPLE